MFSETARLLLPAGIFTFEEVTEKPLLQRFAVCAVEMREVRMAMHLYPLLRGASSQVPFEIAACVQSHAAPVGGRQQWRRYSGKIGRARRVILPVKLAPF